MEVVFQYQLNKYNATSTYASESYEFSMIKY